MSLALVTVETIGFLLSANPDVFPSFPCAAYICGSVPDACTADFQDDIVQASPCPEHTYCSSEGQCESFQEKYAPTVAYVGELCNHSIPCEDSICEQGRCQGKAEGEPCTRHTECEAGLYCGFICRRLIESEEVGCRDDFDCEPAAGCNSGICVTYFSLEAGTHIDHCQSFQSPLCASGLCRDNLCIAGLHTSAAAFPTPCDSSWDCEATDSLGRSYYSPCQCGLNSDSQHYCSVLPSDEVGSDYLSFLSLWTKSEAIHECNTERRWSLHCLLSTWPACRVLEYLYKQYRLREFPKLVDALECVEASITRDYWEIREAFRREAEEAVDCQFDHEYGSFLRENDLSGT